MEILTRVRLVLAAQPNDAQLDSFLSDVRASLAASNRQFLAYAGLIIGTIVTYHLVTYGAGIPISFNGVQITDRQLFRRVFLVVPAAFLAGMASVGYLRKLQREVFDLLAISRYRILGAAGLHELRLPADHVLGLFILYTQEGLVGKITGRLIATLAMTAFVFGPATYVILEAIKNIGSFGLSDVLCLASSIVAIVLCACSLIVVFLAARIRI